MAQETIDLKVVLDIAAATDAAEKFKNDFITSAKAAANSGIGSLKAFAGASDQEFEKLYQQYKSTTEKQADAQKKAAKEAADESARLQKEYQKIANASWDAIGQAAKDAYDEEQKAAGRAFEEIGKAAQQQIAKHEKWNKTVGEVRGIVGDVGDAVSSLGKGFLGLSDNTQLFADKAIYMSEKGMALGQAIGGLAGPLGAVAGSAIGGIAGGLMGLVAANSEIAAKQLLNQANSAIEAERANRNLAKVIKDLKDQMGSVDTSTLEGSIQSFDLAAAAVKKEKDVLEKLRIEADEYRTIMKATVEVTDEQRAKSKDYSDKIVKQIELVSKLKDQEKTAASQLKSQATDRARSTAAETANVTDATRAQLEATLASKKASFDIAKQIAAIKEKTLSEKEDSKEVGKLSKSISKNSAEVKTAKAEYEAAQKALDAFGKSAKTKAKEAVTEATKALKDFNKELHILNDTVVGAVSRDAIDPLFGIIGFTEDDAKNMTGLVADLEKDLGGATKSISDSFTDPLNTFDNFVKLGFNNLQSTLFSKTEMTLASAKVVGQAMTDVGNIAKESIAGVATDSFNSWLETIATGEKSADRSFKVIAAAAVRNIGSQLVADGVKNVLEGSARGIASLGTDPTAGPLIAVGGAEIAAGVGMGAAGARAQRRQGFGDDKKNKGAEKGNLGKAGNNNNGVQTQAPSIINLNMLALTDQRQAENVGKAVAQAQRAYAQGRS